MPIGQYSSQNPNTSAADDLTMTEEEKKRRQMLLDAQGAGSAADDLLGPITKATIKKKKLMDSIIDKGVRGDGPSSPWDVGIRPSLGGSIFGR